MLCGQATPLAADVETDTERLALMSPPEACVLEAWEDADTALVVCGLGMKDVVRLLGIDAAESGFDVNSRSRARDQAVWWQLFMWQVLDCGQAASHFAAAHCPPGSTIQVIGHQRDPYGRRLAYILCEGHNMSALLLSHGHAGRYHFPAPPARPSGCPLPPDPAPLVGEEEEPGQDVDDHQGDEESD